MKTFPAATATLSKKGALTGDKSSFDGGGGALNWRYRQLVRSKSRENRLGIGEACRRKSGRKGRDARVISFFWPNESGIPRIELVELPQGTDGRRPSPGTVNRTAFFSPPNAFPRDAVEQLTRAKLSRQKPPDRRFPRIEEDHDGAMPSNATGKNAPFNPSPLHFSRHTTSWSWSTLMITRMYEIPRSRSRW